MTDSSQIQLFLFTEFFLELLDIWKKNCFLTLQMSFLKYFRNYFGRTGMTRFSKKTKIAATESGHLTDNRGLSILDEGARQLTPRE